MQVTKSYLNELTYRINGAAIEVHRALGPGLLESVYQKCMKHELGLQNILFKSELIVPVLYKGEQIKAELRCDLFVEDLICVELKSVESLLPVHEAQLMTYMKLLESPKGILLNFNVANLYHDGQKTYVNEIFRELPE